MIQRTMRQKTSQITQIKFYKIEAVPMLTYASENWTRIQSDKRRVQSVEVRFLHPVAGYTLLDRKRSTDICSN
jgi:hypothetical protein